MNSFDSSYLLGAFFGLMAIALTYILLEYLSNQRQTIDVIKPIYDRHNSWRFYMKQMIARFLLKLRSGEDLSDQLRVFSEHDEMVNVARVED